MQPDVTSEQEPDAPDQAPPPTSRSGGRATLRGDLRAALPEAGAAVGVTVAVFLLLYARMRSGTSATVAVMPFMADPDTFWMYLLSQAFGWSGLLWAWGTVMLGLLRSGPGAGRPRIPRSVLERWHRTSSLTTMALMAAHALMFAAELVRYDAGTAWLPRLWGRSRTVSSPAGTTREPADWPSRSAWARCISPFPWACSSTSGTASARTPGAGCTGS
ncbi:hypothetical protein GCM10014713_05970 [Streptomyces purpureus]|uniref:Ferric oxidoreductase domain-containing protein n=1 Tax=Streptomyces purpureus TaxID=1951 RepID=A0A918GYN7_9ACTN|nr:hypothetical protein GCM10014713_05970 [Streptomyces purpureus]